MKKGLVFSPFFINSSAIVGVFLFYMNCARPNAMVEASMASSIKYTIIFLVLFFDKAGTSQDIIDILILQRKYYENNGISTQFRKDL